MRGVRYFIKKITLSIILSLLLFSLVGCKNKIEQHNKTNDNSIENSDNKNKKDIKVKIISSMNQENLSQMPITLTANLSEEYPNELQYHWILENDSDFEGFVVSGKGPQKEIINSGEPVELGLFAEVQWVEGAVNEFKVKLQIEDKETVDIVTTNEIIIENKQGIYRVKQ